MRLKIYKGFTLVELLVVLAIISLISSIVLASLKDARNKAKLSSIEGMTLQLRTESALYLSTNTNYGGTPLVVYSDYSRTTNTGFFNSAKAKEIINKISDLSGSSIIRYGISNDSWAIGFDTTKVSFKIIDTAYAIGGLPPPSLFTKYVCVDSSGNIVQKEMTTTTFENTNVTTITTSSRNGASYQSVTCKS